VKRKILQVAVIALIILFFAACANQLDNYYDTAGYYSLCTPEVVAEPVFDAAVNEDTCDYVADEQYKYEEVLIEDENDEIRTEPNQYDVSYENGYICMLPLVYQATEPIDFVPFIPQLVEISEYGRQVATEFLSQMTTIFTGTGEAETLWDDERTPTGRFLLGWEQDDNDEARSVTTYEVPEIYFIPWAWQGIRGIFNRYGEKITEAPWLIVSYQRYYYVNDNTTKIYAGMHNYARDFMLFDFIGSGIPDILVFFAPIFHGDTEIWPIVETFRYVDGEYRKLEQGYGSEMFFQFWNGLFVDENGRIIHYINDGYHGFFAYVHLVITNRYSTRHLLFDRDVVFDIYRLQAWGEHHWLEWVELPNGTNFLDGWHLHNPTIFGTDISLTPLTSLTNLEAEIFTYLQHKRQPHE